MSTALECDPRRPKPRWAGPMLAVLTDERFSCDEWLFERKLDGERCLASRRSTGLRLLARTHPSWGRPGRPATPPQGGCSRQSMVRPDA
jgi:ATP-dependent DNA ligase